MSLKRFGPNFPTLFAAAILQELSFGVLVHLPGYLSDLGATEGLIGLLYSASAIVSLVSRPWLGRILDLTHRRTVMLVVGTMNITVLLLLLTTSVWGPWLWLLFLSQRVFQVSLFTSIITYGADSIPLERRTQGLAIFGLSGLIPISIVGYLGDGLLALNGFNALFWAAASFSILSWFVVWALPVLPVRGRQPRRGFWQALVQKNMLPLWFAALLFFVGIETMFTFTRTYFDERQVGSVGLFFVIYGASAAITRIFGGSRYDTMPHRTVLVSAVSIFGAGLLLMGLAESIVPLVFAALIMGSAHGVAFPLLSSEVVNRARVSERGSAMSIFTALFDVALLIGAPAVGFLIDGFDYLVAFSSAGVTLFVGSMIYTIWDRRLERTEGKAIAEAQI